MKKLEIEKCEKVNDLDEIPVNKNTLIQVFNFYLNRIDDYYEAENEFIADLNSIFKLKGSGGIISIEMVNEIKNLIKEYTRD